MNYNLPATMIPLAYYLGMPKTLIKIWRWISHTATAVSVLSWWHTISGAIVAGAAVLTAWLREQDPTILFVVGLSAFAAMMIIFERLATWRYRRQSSVPQKIEASENLDHWTERKQLEIYVLANASSGVDPIALPVDKDPQLTRLRELKDAMKRGEFDATLNGERPNVMSTVSLQSFEQYVAATNKPYWVEVLHRWQARQNQSTGEVHPDWKICEAMDYIAAQFGDENEQDIGKKYLEPTRLLTSKARSGNIQVWGKRIFSTDDAELSQRLIEQSDWSDIELSVWACSPSTRRPHTESASHHSVQQYTDLYVNQSQIKDTRWRDETTNEPSRITLIDLAKEAEKRGWKILDSKSLHVLDFLDGIRQSGADGTLIIYGKQIHSFPQLTRTELFVPIPKDHWPSHQIDLYSFCEYRADRSSKYAEDNCQTRVKGLSVAHGGESFADIHLDRSEALAWLEIEALTHRGKREKRRGPG